MSSGFSSSDDVITREICKTLNLDKKNNIAEEFEVSRCCDWIKERDLNRVALQFPDYLLHSAPLVAKAIKSRLSREVFILGDTSYGECCVDEVAAEHLNADSVIHFGHTCLTPPQRLPVLYIFTRRDIDVPLFVSTIRSNFTETDNLLILYDVEYEHALRHFQVGDWGGLVCLGHPCSPADPAGLASVKKFGRQFDVEKWEDLKDYKTVYLSGGGGTIKLMNFMFSFAANEFYVYEKESLTPVNTSINKLLMKRYFLVEKTKDAERIGILVGTLGAANYANIIERLRSTIKKAGKRCYTFLVGKPNAAKLANFPEIDIFVLVACPETTFPDTSDFYQSVITPYELEMACNPARVWGGEYVTDFRELLPGGVGFVEIPVLDPEEEEVPDVSLVSGRVRAAPGATNQGGGELVVVNNRTVGLLHSGGGGEFLAHRSWSGLEQNLGKTDVDDVVLGQTGIAAGYRPVGQSADSSITADGPSKTDIEADGEFKTADDQIKPNEDELKTHDFELMTAVSDKQTLVEPSLLPT